MGFDFVILLETLLCVTYALIVSAVIHWHLGLILLCLLIIVVVVSLALGKVIMIVESIKFIEVCHRL
jgi:hypothetical protein